MIYVVIVLIASIAAIVIQIRYANKKLSIKYLIPVIVLILSIVLFAYSQLSGEHLLITGNETNGFERLLKILVELIIYNVLTIILFVVSSRR